MNENIDYLCSSTSSSVVQNDVRVNRVKQFKDMKILSLNVCGLTSKQDCPDFIDFMRQYDIIGYQETKMNNLDTFLLEGYTFHFKHRNNISKRKSGGIAIGFKNDISQFVHVIETESRLVYWFTISKRYTKCEDILCGVIYIPPENSEYANESPFNEIQQELDAFTNKYSTICLLGDFNSRCKQIKDYILPDIDILELHNSNELSVDFQNQLESFNDTQVTVDRKSEDKSTNNYGYKFIEFLQQNDFFILNGRTRGDEEGMTTFNDISTIDYYVCTTNLFKHVNKLNVLEMCPLLSDAHCPIALTLKFGNDAESNTRLDNTKRIKLWDQNCSSSFINNMDKSKIETILQELTIAETNPESINQNKMNCIADKISTLFVDNSKKTFGYFEKTVKTNSNNTTSWFGKNCRIARNKFHTAKYQYKLRKNEENKNNLRLKSKEYKSIMNKYNYEFKTKKASKLKTLGKTNPKVFWKILNGKKHNNVKATLSDCFDHFSKINYNVNADRDNNLENNNQPPHNSTQNQENDSIDEDLNNPITAMEIEKTVRKLKNNKSNGADDILNEHIKSTLPSMINIYTKLFNIVLDSGIIPEAWTYGVINPIFKNKGDAFEAKNYRPITLLSCMGKLFTSIIKNRLQAYSDKHDIINEYQAGFRPEHSTIDNIFALHALIEILHHSKRKLFCGFIDLKGAFDTVWRGGLWAKLVKYNIRGKCLTLIKNMYDGIKSSVRVNGVTSNSFPCNIGVRQGESLSPILFSLFLNDLHDFMANSTVNGIKVSHEQENEALTYLKLFIILYADDTVLMSEKEEDLQEALDAYQKYCEQWKLTVNIDKSKVLIFSKGRPKKYNFTYNNQVIGIVSEYKYLGIYFSRSGAFNIAKKHIANQGRKALYSLLKRSKQLCLPIDLQIDLFNKLVKPILLYGSEVWGYGNIEVIERVQLKFLKHVLKAKNSTPNSIVYGETGVMPLSIDIQTRQISYWSKLLSNDTKLASKIYVLMYKLHSTIIPDGNKKHFRWIENIRNIFIKTGNVNIWLYQDFPNHKWLKDTTNQRLKDLFLNEWYNSIETSNSCVTYRLLKNTFGFEKYLINTPTNLLTHMMHFRTTNHRLPISTGRWNKIERNNRICTLCEKELGDEYHYLLVCKNLTRERNSYLNPKYFDRPNVLKFKNIMTTNNKTQFIKLCEFVKIILNKFK